MKILRGDNQNIDFERPLELNNDQIIKFIDYFKNNFYFIETEEFKFPRTERIGDKFFTKEWASEEDSLLFDISMNTEDMAKSLGRSWMSVDIRRGHIMPKILNYADKKGVDIYKVDIKELIEEYRKEHQEELFKKKEERKAENRTKKEEEKEYLQLKQDIPKFEALINSLISQITPEKLDEKKKRLEELREKFEDLDEDKGEEGDRKS